jgi:hypothetical protein
MDSMRGRLLAEMTGRERLQVHLSVWRKQLAVWQAPTAEQRATRSRFCCLVDRGDWEAAAAMQEDAMALARDVRGCWPEVTAQLLEKTGRVREAVRDFEGAHAAHKESLELAQEYGDADGECRAFMMTGPRPGMQLAFSHLLTQNEHRSSSQTND